MSIEFVTFVAMPVMAVSALAFVYWYASRENRPGAPRP